MIEHSIIEVKLFINRIISSKVISNCGFAGSSW